MLGLIANKKQTGVDDYYLGGRSMGALKIGALWPSFGVSAILYVVICLTHHQTPAEQKKAERFYAAK